MTQWTEQPVLPLHPVRERLHVSFSGGETSAAMTAWLVKNASEIGYKDVKVVFANTGQERKETLDFVHACDKHFGWGVVWVEAVVHYGKRKGCTHKVVSYETASRNGEPFEAAIRKYGIPNQAFPWCTRELKVNALQSYIRSLGWEKESYNVAIGIRADEADRIPAAVLAMEDDGTRIYPLAPSSRWPHVAGGVAKPDVNAFWRDMPFRLNLKGYQGNCAWCWKKTLRKHYTLIHESPEIYDFPARMEELYPDVGAGDGGRVFFRKKTSTKRLLEEALAAKFEPFHDDAVVYPGAEQELDKTGTGSCGDSCEVDSGWEETQND